MRPIDGDELSQQMADNFRQASRYGCDEPMYSVVVETIDEALTLTYDDLVPHGEWAHLGGDEWCCTKCAHVITTEGSWERPTAKYCEECGAKIDGGTP